MKKLTGKKSTPQQAAKVVPIPVKTANIPKQEWLWAVVFKDDFHSWLMSCRNGSLVWTNPDGKLYEVSFAFKGDEKGRFLMHALLTEPPITVGL
jgi:hypothetical protein